MSDSRRIVSPSEFHALMIRKDMQYRKVGYGLGSSLLSGSSDLLLKVNGFIDRLVLLVGEKNLPVEAISSIRKLADQVSEQINNFQPIDKNLLLNLVTLIEETVFQAVKARFNVTSIAELLKHNEYSCSKISILPISPSLLKKD